MAKRSWPLPKPRRSNPVRGGYVTRQDGEPRWHELSRWHSEETTLSGDMFIRCCDCDLEHHYIVEVARTRRGEWLFGLRAYRLPGTGKAAKKR